MEHIYQGTEDVWVRPWNETQFNDIYNRDERFFSVITKGLISWLTRNIVMYDKSIKHFIYNTGSSYMYLESNGYKFSWNETSGEDMIYMEMPRCVISMGDINIPFEELTSPFARGNFERRSNNEIKGYNAQIRRLPIEITYDLKYVLSNFNESIILAQELIDKCMFQRYFNVAYLGNVIKCSIEFQPNLQIQNNQIDLTSGETRQHNIDLQITICCTYPQIIENTSIPVDHVIRTFVHNTEVFQTHDIDNTVDTIERTIGDDFIEYTE